MKILIIDDEPKIRNGLTHLLSAHPGWSVAGAFADASAAMQFLYDTDCNVIISDIKMPGMSGLDMIQDIRTRNRDIPILILSGYATFSFAQRAIELGVRKFLTKPTNPEELTAALEQIEADQRKETENLRDEAHAETSNLLVLRAIQYLQTHYGGKVSLKMVADALYISPNYLSELFRKQTGENFSDYLLGIRMKKSQTLLRDISYKISEIAEMTGFHDSRYFSSTFKKYYGITPLEYRNRSAQDLPKPSL
ncbi:response regulator [Oscillibacter sp.]|uniref:response regulator transcription factor n=1 Tax=Oscillibacter sp. TaxID=1945593 RepID=UPI0028AF7A08|nr:response regulator [Oscillibacter sp.]